MEGDRKIMYVTFVEKKVNKAKLSNILRQNMWTVFLFHTTCVKRSLGQELHTNGTTLTNTDH